MSIEEAAFETPTGKWAEQNGVINVSYRPDIDIKKDKVILKYLN